MSQKKPDKDNELLGLELAEEELEPDLDFSVGLPLEEEESPLDTIELSVAEQIPADDTIRLYLRDVQRTPLLTAEAERELALRIEQGDMAARNKMIESNLRLVIKIAKRYNNRGLPFLDLIEEGNLGLMRAVEGFDPAMGTRFSTYASYWIKQSIKRALINCAKTVRIPAYMVELLSKWRRATARLTEELGRTPTAEEIARILGVPRKKLPIIKRTIRIYNLTPQTDQGDNGWSLGEMIEDERFRSPDETLLEHDSMFHNPPEAPDHGSPRAAVLKMRFGLEDRRPRTLKEIGEVLG